MEGVPVKVGKGKNIMVVPVEGDAMYPELRHGDVVFINTATPWLYFEGLYAYRFSEGESAHVARIQILEKEARLIQTNSHYPEMVVKKEKILILGPVVGALKKI